MASLVYLPIKLKILLAKKDSLLYNILLFITLIIYNDLNTPQKLQAENSVYMVGDIAMQIVHLYIVRFRSFELLPEV